MTKNTGSKRKVAAGVALITVATVLVLLFGVGPYIINPILYPEQTLYNQAQTLQNQGNYPAALQKYQDVIDTYPDTYWARLALRAKVECNHAYISNLIAQQKYDEAIQHYVYSLNSAEWSVDYDKVLANVPANVLFDWATNLQGQNTTVALRLLEKLVEHQPNSEITPQAETAIVDIVMANTSAYGYDPLGHTSFLGGYNSTGAYSTTSGQFGGNTEIIVINDTPSDMVVLLKGAVTKRIFIESSPNSTRYSEFGGPSGAPPAIANNVTMTLPPGTYEVVFTGNSSYGGLYGEQIWSGDTSYEYWIYSDYGF